MKVKAVFALWFLGMNTMLNGAASVASGKAFEVAMVPSADKGTLEVQQLFYEFTCVGPMADVEKARALMPYHAARFQRFIGRPHVLFFVRQEKGSGMQKSWPIVGQLLINTDTGSIDILAHIGTPEEKKMVRALLLAEVAKLDLVPLKIFYVTYGPVMPWHTLF